MKVQGIKAKQEYRPPKLHIYGDLTEMTKANARGMNSDHQGSAMLKTG